MKKKILAVALTIFTVMAIVISGIAVYAEDYSTYRINSTVDNDQLIVSVTLPGDAGVSSGNFTLKYNSENLQYDHVEGRTEGQFNPAYGEDTMRLSYASVYPYTEDTVLVTVVFNIKNGKVSADDISLTAYKLYNENGQTISDQNDGEADVAFTCTHKFGAWTVVKEATENEEGLKERVCSVCGEKETQVIEVLKPSDTGASDTTAPDDTKPSDTKPSDTAVPDSEKPSDTKPSAGEPEVTSPNASENPSTGSSSYIGIALLAAAAAAGIAVTRKKHKK